MDAVLVVNADLGPLHRVSLKHAIRMLLRRVAEIHEAEPDRLIGVYPMPKVVRLVRYVVTRWRYTAGPAWSPGYSPATAGGVAIAAATRPRSTTCCPARAVAATPGPTPSQPVKAAMGARMTAPPPRRAWCCGPSRRPPVGPRWPRSPCAERPAGPLPPAGRDGS